MPRSILRTTGRIVASSIIGTAVGACCGCAIGIIRAVMPDKPPRSPEQDRALIHTSFAVAKEILHQVEYSMHAREAKDAEQQPAPPN